MRTPDQMAEDKRIMDARRAIARRFRQSIDQVTEWDAEQYLKGPKAPPQESADETNKPKWTTDAGRI